MLRWIHKQLVIFKYNNSWSHKYLDPVTRVLNDKC